jgi:hypothetical protein
MENKPKKRKLKNHFYLSTDNGIVAHVNMNPDADKETFDAVKKMIELAYHKVN